MQVFTHLTPGQYNAIKFVLVLIFVNHMLTWAGGKLKRATNVADLVRGVPVHINSVADDDGRGTIKDAFRSFFGIFKALWVYIYRKLTFTEEDKNDDVMATRTAQDYFQIPCRILLRAMPFLTIASLFVIEYGTELDKRCVYDDVRFSESKFAAEVLAGSLRCTRPLNSSRERDSRTRLHFQYADSYLLGQDVVCGCADWTRTYCVSKYNGSRITFQKTVSWNTVIGIADLTYPKLLLLEQVRQDFALQHHISWIPFSEPSAVHNQCFSYNDSNRTSVACVQEHALKILDDSYNEVIMVARSQNLLSYIFFIVPQRENLLRNGDLSVNFIGIIDGPKLAPLGTPLVLQTKSSQIPKLYADTFIAGISEIMTAYKLWYWIGSNEERAAVQLARIVTASITAQFSAPGTVQTCTGTILTLNILGTSACLFLILMFTIILAMAAIATPEPVLQMFTRGEALESVDWAVKHVLARKIGSSFGWFGNSVNASAVLETTGNQRHINWTRMEMRGEKCPMNEISSIQ